MKLFCFSYAGGTANNYLTWKQQLIKNIELCPIDLKGKGARYSEEFYSNIGHAVSDIGQLLMERLHTNSEDFALFGHSLGALLCYELFFELKKRGLADRLKHIFFSGCDSPDLIPNQRKISNLEDGQFIDEIFKMGGVNEEHYNEELFQIFLPIIKADMRLFESYEFEEKGKISVDSTLLRGSEDSFCEENNSWQKLCKNELSVEIIEGDHFFLNKNKAAVIEVINTTLKGV